MTIGEDMLARIVCYFIIGTVLAETNRRTEDYEVFEPWGAVFLMWPITMIIDCIWWWSHKDDV